MSGATQAAFETPVNTEENGFINHTSGYLALTPRKDRFRITGLPGFISYKEQRKHLILFGGVHAPRNTRADLLDRFLKVAGKQNRQVIALQLHEEQIPLFNSRGFITNQMGASCGLCLSDFSYAGTARMKLRHKIKRAREIGLSVREVGREIPDDERTYSRILKVSEAWVQEKGGKELDFLIGEIGQPGQEDRRIFVVVSKTDQIIGFITYVPVWGSYPGYLHDLTRRSNDAPVGAMELCNAFALERFKEERIEHLHFGFTPFILDGTRNAGESNLLAVLFRAVYKYGARFYPAQSQWTYKLKWNPDIIEREYIAFRKLSLPAFFDVLTLTRTV